MSPEQRSENARKAALARWEGLGKAARATHWGEIEIADAAIPCAVLEDERRVLTQEGVLSSIGRAKKAKAGTGASLYHGSVDRLPAFLSASNLSPFITEELAASTTPIRFQRPRGGIAYGYPAKILPAVCSVFLKAKTAGKLRKGQDHIAARCAILMEGLATVGITALVDEATGYQYDRATDALQKILEDYIAKELARWVKVFPDEYYRLLFQLKGLDYDYFSTKRPPYIGKLTNDIVYERLAPGVREELQRKNPKAGAGSRRRARHHQWLTRDVGHPRLQEHLYSVCSLMRSSYDWDDFKRRLDLAHPRYGSTVPIRFRRG